MRRRGSITKSLPKDVLGIFLENINKPEQMRWPVGDGYFSIFIASLILCNLKQRSICQCFDSQITSHL